MNDLSQAIRDVLTGGEDKDGKVFVVPLRLVKILQDEYNIYFVEPDDKQLEVV